jgi:hypothetical protein
MQELKRELLPGAMRLQQLHYEGKRVMEFALNRLHHRFLSVSMLPGGPD